MKERQHNLNLHSRKLNRENMFSKKRLMALEEPITTDMLEN